MKCQPRPMRGGTRGTLYCCDRKSRVTCAQSFTLWQQATIEFTCPDHSPRTLVVTFNGSQVNIGRASTPRSLFYCLYAPHICMVLFFTHIPFVVNHTFNGTPPERLQHYQGPVGTKARRTKLSSLSFSVMMIKIANAS